jgi:hypothetical protein
MPALTQDTNFDILPARAWWPIEVSEHIAFGQDEGRIDFRVFEATKEQVKRCRFRLENALAERRSHK